MVQIKHSINLVTTLDENHRTSKQILALENPEKFLAKIFESFLLNEDIFNKLNQNNTFAKVELE
jgi:hypothetical protein